MGVQLAYNVVRHTPLTTYAEVDARKVVGRACKAANLESVFWWSRVIRGQISFKKNHLLWWIRG